jgi:hypothetical protein
VEGRARFAAKSTLTIALLRGGLDLLGDDMAFLRDDGVLQTLALPEKIDITDRTVEFFEELHPLRGQAKHLGWPKQEIDAMHYFPTSIAWRTQPAVIVFPRIGERFESVLEPMDADAAFLELAPNVLLTEMGATCAHFEILARLTRIVPSYRLFTGRDFDRIPSLMRGLVTVCTEDPKSETDGLGSSKLTGAAARIRF